MNGKSLNWAKEDKKNIKKHKRLITLTFGFFISLMFVLFILMSLYIFVADVESHSIDKMLPLFVLTFLGTVIKNFYETIMKDLSFSDGVNYSSLTEMYIDSNKYISGMFIFILLIFYTSELILLTEGIESIILKISLVLIIFIYAVLQVSYYLSIFYKNFGKIKILFGIFIGIQIIYSVYLSCRLFFKNKKIQYVIFNFKSGSSKNEINTRNCKDIIKEKIKIIITKILTLIRQSTRSIITFFASF